MNGNSNGSSNGPVPLWIDGKEVTTSTTFDIVSPYDSKTLWSSSNAGTKEATQAVESAQNAFKTWRKTKPAQIRTILLKAADIMESRQAELLSYMKQETGALDNFATFNTTTTIENIRDVAGRVSGIMGAIPITQTPGTGALVFKEPYGVVFGMAPWNAPYILGCRSFLYALAAGNTVVFKGSELCSRTMWALGSVFHEAGLPAGVLNVLYTRPQDAADVTSGLIAHPAVKKINFTGSTPVGTIIATSAAKEVKPVLLELGGKASAIVCADADIEKAAFQCALGSFLHAGQICMATERILVNRSVLPQFQKALKGAVEKVYNPENDAPVLVAKATVEKNEKLMRDAMDKGAEVVYGDAAGADAFDKEKYRMRPMILSGVKKDMDIFYTESFGPSVSLIAVDSDEEAIEVANDTEYGLSGAVFTESLGRGLRIARAVDSGAVHINSMSVHDEAGLPHGGVKKSGMGRFNGGWGLEEFLKLKTVTFEE